MIRHFLLLFLLLPALAQASVYRPGQASFRTINGTAYWQGTGSIAGGTATTIESVEVGGVYVGMPWAGSIGSAAVDIAVAGLRSTPLALATSIVLPYLATKGIQLVNGLWMSQGDPVAVIGRYSIPQFGVTGTTPAEVCDKAAAAMGAGYYVSGTPTTTCLLKNDAYPFGQWSYSIFDNQANSCPSGYSFHPDGTCWPNDLQPAGDSDWAKVRGEIPPDEVMNDLCKKIAALNTTSPGCPTGTPVGTVQKVALSDWHADPATGLQTRDMATVSPAPTADDPTRVAVDTTTETKTPVTDANGQPVTDANGDPVTTTDTKKTTEQQDLCAMHPDIIACSQLGDPPDDLDLEHKDVSAQITPDSGWGPSNGSCPADKSYALHNGFTFRMSYAPICETATTLRPIIIGIGWFVAALIFVGYTRKMA